MRVLFVSTHFPYNPAKCAHGIFQRMRMFAEAIRTFADLEFLFFVPEDCAHDQEARDRMVQALQHEWRIGATVSLCPTRFPRKRWGKAIRRLEHIIDYRTRPNFAPFAGPRQVACLERCLAVRPDLLFLHRLSSAAPAIRSSCDLPPVVIDLDDVEHIALLRSGKFCNWRGKLANLATLPGLIYLEYKVLRRARTAFVCSETDRDYLRKWPGIRSIQTVPNSVELPPEIPLPREPTVLFLGSYRYTPNQEAAAHLIRNIWPGVRSQVPGSRLLIAGPEPERIPAYAEAKDDVEFTGFVEDLNHLYRRARVVCTPIEVGAGTRVKIIEAAAYGRPVVSTSIGAEGLAFARNSEILIRDGTSEITQALIHLLTDEINSRKLGRAARLAVTRHYDRSKIKRRVSETLRRAISQGRGQSPDGVHRSSERDQRESATDIRYTLKKVRH